MKSKISKAAKYAIENFVTIEKLESEEGTEVFLLKFGGVPIRPYITFVETKRVADYMKREIIDPLVDKIVENKDLAAEDVVDIIQATTNQGTFYTLRVVKQPLRMYIEGYEAQIHKNFMVDVVNQIIKQIRNT